MNLTCLLHHHWEGCRCTRCGEVRDEQDDWNHCRCRRCGLSRFSHHDWQGCECSVCGKEQHKFVDGICTACGAACDHGCGPDNPDVSYPPSLAGGAAGKFGWKCARCSLMVYTDLREILARKKPEKAQPAKEIENDPARV